MTARIGEFRSARRRQRSDGTPARRTRPSSAATGFQGTLPRSGGARLTHDAARARVRWCASARSAYLNGANISNALWLLSR